MSRKWVTVAQEGELQPGQYKSVEIEDQVVAVFNVEGEFYATDDVCTHDGGILTGGELNGKVITCPRHGAKFDVTSGEVRQMPAFEPISTYETRVEDGDVQVLFES